MSDLCSLARIARDANFLERRLGEVPRINLPKLFGNPQARANLLTIKRIIAT